MSISTSIKEACHPDENIPNIGFLRRFLIQDCIPCQIDSLLCYCFCPTKERIKTIIEFCNVSECLGSGDCGALEIVFLVFALPLVMIAGILFIVLILGVWSIISIIVNVGIIIYCGIGVFSYWMNVSKHPYYCFRAYTNFFVFSNSYVKCFFIITLIQYSCSIINVIGIAPMTSIGIILICTGELYGIAFMIPVGLLVLTTLLVGVEYFMVLIVSLICSSRWSEDKKSFKEIWSEILKKENNVNINKSEEIEETYVDLENEIVKDNQVIM